jgi:hypothetical protein
MNTNSMVDNTTSSSYTTDLAGCGSGGGSGDGGAMEGALKLKVQSNNVIDLVSNDPAEKNATDDKKSNLELAKIDEIKGKDDNDDSEEVPVQYDSDGIPGGSGHRRSASPGSVGSSGTSGSGASKGKRRSWKKPKDKPKRPLSSYNIFFKHERSRIVDGKTEEATAEETIRSIEIILSTSRETRRHRKTHGRITFGDLARRIADKWKAISPEQKALFDHYAGLDMRRYRKEVQLWKDKKEYESRNGSQGQDGSISYSDSVSEYSEGMNPGMGDPLGSGSAHSNHSRPRQHDPWAPRKNFYENMNNSFSSVDSEFSMDPLPMRMMRQQQQLSQKRSSQANFHSSMPNIGANFLQDNVASMMGHVQNSNNIMFPGMQQQGGGGGGGGGFDIEQDLSPLDLQGTINNQNTLLGTLSRERHQQQQMMLQNQFEMGFQHQQQQVSAMHNSFSGRPSQRMHSNINNNVCFPDSVPIFVGSNNNDNNQDMNGSFQQISTNANTNMSFQTPVHPDAPFSFHTVTSPENGMDPVPFNEVFPDDNPGGKDLENYLSNLDLTQM